MVSEQADLVVGSKTGVATIRTVIPAMWVTFVFWLIARFTSIELTEQDLLVLTPVLGGVLAFVYRVGRALEERYPWVGTVLFGVNSPPMYEEAIETTATDTSSNSGVGTNHRDPNQRLD